MPKKIMFMGYDRLTSGQQANTINAIKVTTLKRTFKTLSLDFFGLTLKTSNFKTKLVKKKYLQRYNVQPWVFMCIMSHRFTETKRHTYSKYRISLSSVLIVLCRFHFLTDTIPGLWIKRLTSKKLIFITTSEALPSL